MKAPNLKWLFFCVIILSVISCSKDDEKPVIEEKVLVSATKIESRTVQELQTLIQFSGRDIDPSIFKYNVNLYEVTYKTHYKGDEVIASGIIALPFTTQSMGMLSFQHGTIVQQNEAPSAQQAGSFDLLVYAAMASSGFITIVPDMIGFGESKNIFHPYYVEEPTADAVVDNILAAKELAADNNVTFNNKLFLAGYSQGGYATMAAHKAIEAGALDGIDLIASFPAAGGYDIQAMQDYFFGLDQYQEPYYIAYVGLSYKSFYGYNNILTDFFNDPYAGRIPLLFDGTNSSGNINSQLTTNVPGLIREDLRLNLDTHAKYQYIRDAFSENSLTDWVPTVRMYMYHGDEDLTVPFENSFTTYQKLLSNGASTEIVQLIELPGADHGSGVEPYIDDVIKKLQQLK